MQNSEIETAINKLSSDSLNETTGLLSKFYNSYYDSKRSNRELNNLIEFILVHLVNNINEKLNNRTTDRLLFQPHEQHQSCNQIFDSYNRNIKQYLDKLNDTYSNRILIKLNQVPDKEIYYEVEQYRRVVVEKCDEEEYVYLNKLDCVKAATFCDYDQEYRFRLVVYKRKNLVKIPLKQAYFTHTRTNESFYRQLSLKLLDLQNETTGDVVNLIVFRFSYFLDLLNNFKTGQINTLLTQIMQLIDQQQIDTILNYDSTSGDGGISSDLVVSLNDVKLLGQQNAGYFYLDVKFSQYACQSACLVTDCVEVLHFKGVNFDFLLEKAPQSVTISVYKYNTIIELISQSVYKLNLVELINSESTVAVTNKFLTLNLRFQLNRNLKLNQDLLNYDLATPSGEILDNCLKISKKEQHFHEVHLKKLLQLIAELQKSSSTTTNNQHKEQLFKLLISVLSSVNNENDLADAATTNTNNELCKYLIQNLKCAFETETVAAEQQADFILLLRSFHLVVYLILRLTTTSNDNFKLSLKYDLNYIFMKISKKPFQTKFFIYSFINFKFISILFTSQFYTNNEIYEIICSKLFNDASMVKQTDEFASYLKLVEEIILEKLLNSHEFAQVLASNYEFRTKFIKFIVNNFLINCSRIDSTRLDILFNLINDLAYKFDKKEFKSIFRVTLSTFELNYKCNEESVIRVESENGQEMFEFRLFLCLIDLITQSVSITSIQQLNNYFDNLKLTDFVYVFQLFSYFVSNKDAYNYKLVWTSVHDALSQYQTLIFKYLLRVIAILTIESTAIEHEIEILFVSYFKLEFLLSKQSILGDLTQISNFLGKYKQLNEFLIKSSITALLNCELNETEFLKIIEHLVNCNQSNEHLLEILVVHEILENDKVVQVKNEALHSVFTLIQLCSDYKQAMETATKIEQKILAFRLYQLISQIKLTEFVNFTEKVFKMKFEIEYKLIKSLIRLNQTNYYEIIVLYKHKLDLLSKYDGKKVIKADEIEKFYHLNLFKYLCLYELSTVTKQHNQQQDINLIKIHNKSIYNQLFQIYKHIYKYFIKNSSNFKLIEYINLKLNELNSKLNNTDESLKLVDEKLLFKNTYFYFCVGFFSNTANEAIRKSITNRYYLYTSKTNEHLTVIQNYVLDNFEPIRHTIQLLSLNQDPLELIASASATPETIYIQVFALKLLQKDDLVKLLEDTLDNEEQINEYKSKIENDKKYFYYDKPFFKNFDNNIENLWIERTVMFVYENGCQAAAAATTTTNFDFIEYFNEFIEVKCFIKMFLQPVQNAINDCNEKTIELREFINNFTLNNKSTASADLSEIMSKLQPLTMRLLGCLDARVNGGIRLYIKSFLNQAYLLNNSENAKKRKYFCYQLYLSIKNQLNVLESGLTIHNRIIKQLLPTTTTSESTTNTSNNENLNSLEDSQSINNHQENETTTTTKTTNIEHMRQLNKHLISCLNLLKNELDDFF